MTVTVDTQSVDRRMIADRAHAGGFLRRPHARRWALLGIGMALSLVAACDSSPGSNSVGAKVGYKPPFVPIELSVNSSGEVSFSAGTEIVTPIGTFSIGADMTTVSEGRILLIINHLGSGGFEEQARYEIATDQKLGVCFDGASYGEFEERRITLNAFGPGSRIRIVAQGTACPRANQQRVRPQAQDTIAGYQVATVAVGNASLTVLVAQTPDQQSRGMSGMTVTDLGQIDGMLYLLPTPQVFDPVTGSGAFTFPGYLIATEIHFFDVNGAYWAGGPVDSCGADGRDCEPYYASLYDSPVPYQYVLELVRGRLGAVPAGTFLTA